MSGDHATRAVATDPSAIRAQIPAHFRAQRTTEIAAPCACGVPQVSGMEGVSDCSTSAPYLVTDDHTRPRAWPPLQRWWFDPRPRCNFVSLEEPELGDLYGKIERNAARKAGALGGGGGGGIGGLGGVGGSGGFGASAAAPQAIGYYRHPFARCRSHWKYEQALCHRPQMEYHRRYCHGYFLPRFGAVNASATHAAFADRYCAEHASRTLGVANGVRVSAQRFVLQTFPFFGITEHFLESLCLFLYQVQQSQPLAEPRPRPSRNPDRTPTRARTPTLTTFARRSASSSPRRGASAATFARARRAAAARAARRSRSAASCSGRRRARPSCSGRARSASRRCASPTRSCGGAARATSPCTRCCATRCSSACACSSARSTRPCGAAAARARSKLDATCVTEPRLVVEPKDVSPRERHQHQTVPVEYHRKLRPVPPPLLAALRPAPRL